MSMKLPDLIIGSLLLMAFPCSLDAQETPVLIHTEARLENVLILKITPDMYVEFGVQQINEKLYQITKQPDDILFSVESTTNWDLAISAENDYFTGVNDSTRKVPLDFLGFQIENRGTNWDNGLFSNMANATKDTIVYLSPVQTRLLASGVQGNIGGSDANAFVLRWKFFYEDEVLKTKKYSDIDIEDDNYSVGFYITLSETMGYNNKNNE